MGRGGKRMRKREGKGGRKEGRKGRKKERGDENLELREI